jgi:hypothetical protein
MVGREYDEELSIANTDLRRVLAIESGREAGSFSFKQTGR